VLLDAGDSAPHLWVKRSGDELGEVLGTHLLTDAADRSSWVWDVENEGIPPFAAQRSTWALATPALKGEWQH
jgi:hypothetical protein